MNQDLLESVIKGMEISPESNHGIEHWKRVEKIGHYLSESTRANKNVISLFALFHDCRRINTGIDKGHGLRGARLAIEMRDAINIREDPFNLLIIACAGHTDLTFYNDCTIATCWDADRLDLGRVGVTPDKKHLNTDMAKLLSTNKDKKNAVVYKNVRRISDTVFKSYYDETEYILGDTIKSDNGIYIYLTQDSANTGAFVDEKESYQIEMVIDSLDNVKMSKKKQHYVQSAKFTRVIKKNGELK